MQKIKVYLLLSLNIICCDALHAGAAASRASKDPWQPIRYSKAFDQDELWRENRTLMKQLGCGRNVFDEAERQDNDYHAIMTDQPYNADEFAALQVACMRKLNNERRWALAEPGKYAVIEMCATAAGAAAAIMLLGSESVGGSFGGFVAIFDSLRLINGTIQSGCNLISWPDNPLEVYEDRFAQNKCFIPRALWPKIIRELMSARQNEFSREVHTHFLNFALGFTTFKPLPPLQLWNEILQRGRTRDEIKDVISDRIDDFFRRYYKQVCQREACLVKLNTEKFIDKLFDRTSRSDPRYIFLVGSGGIGKTYFVEQLSAWIDELLPGSVNFENVVIHAAEDLEGTPERPGALLKVLHNQLIQNKRGSVVMLDEATWLNEPSMRSAAKRTFNLDQSKLFTTYFGNGPDGMGIELAMPPMLIFAASNEPITDSALASRFDIIHYPMPNDQALIDHATDSLAQSSTIRRSRLAIDEEDVQTWIENLDESQKNFRDVAGSVEAEFLVRG